MSNNDHISRATALAAGAVGASVISWVPIIDIAFRWISAVFSITLSAIAVYEYCKKRGWIK